jgi:hypothetical protein
MTREDIIRWAHEASPDMTWYAAIDEPDQASPEELGFLQRFAALVAAALRDEMWEKAVKLVADAVASEREACAKVAKETVCDMHLGTGIKIYGTKAAAAIRARGQS